MAGFANLLIEVLLSHVLPSLGSCLKMFQLIITMIIVIMCKKKGGIDMLFHTMFLNRWTLPVHKRAVGPGGSADIPASEGCRSVWSPASG